MNKAVLEKRLTEVEEERKWLKRALKVIEDGKKFQTEASGGGKDIPAATTAGGSAQEGL